MIGGVVMWYCMLKSGVHSTIAGVLLAFAIPFGKGERNPSYSLQHALHYPVALIILPLFALANTAIVFPSNLTEGLTTPIALGIIFGLIAGKAVGILGVSYAAVRLGMVSLPRASTWRHMAGVSLLAGIGFTMSIFIANLAFTDATLITLSKISILVASVTAAVIGLVLLLRNRPTPAAALTEENISL
jgi:NhaA family Na+:H+ antiporter